MLKGNRLKAGSRLGLIAPANSVDKDDLVKAKDKLEEMGFKVTLGKSCISNWFSFGGTDKIRADDINTMFADNNIDGIIALRGGYGSIRLLDLINYEIIKQNPKVFIGYSDITSLHNVFNSRCSLITFHGPMAVSNISDSFDSITSKSFFAATSGKNDRYILESYEAKNIKTIREGSAKGRIVGGNLSVIISGLGTEYEIDTKDNILFIEEVNEPTYKIDRMLIQLRLAGKLEKATGIILGDFKNCTKDKDKDFSLEEVFSDVFSNYSKPVMYNIKSGHCKPMLTIPMGAMAQIDSKLKTIEILENTVK